jgi:hypothetical protein
MSYRPPFLDNPRLWSTSPRHAFDPKSAYAGSVYRASFLERVWRRFFGGK